MSRETSPTPQQIETLREYCRKDVEILLPDIAEFLGRDEEAAKQFYSNLRPAVVVDPNRLTNFTGVHYNLLENHAPLNNPYGAIWIAIRRGQTGAEKLPEAKEQLNLQAETYASLTLAAYQVVTEAGYQGYIDFLNQTGYTSDRLQALFSSVRAFKDSQYPEVTEAAEIRLKGWPKAMPLFDLATIDGALKDYFPNGLPEIIYDGYDRRKASALLLATVNSQNQVELKPFIVRGQETDEDILIHEKTHVLFACLMAKTGDIPRAISSIGEHETYAWAASGFDIGESIFFATCAEAAYNYCKIVDSICSSTVPEETIEGYKTRVARELSEVLRNSSVLANPQTGLNPVPGSEVVPFGAYSVPYFTDVVAALPLRQKAITQGITQPVDLFDLLTASS